MISSVAMTVWIASLVHKRLRDAPAVAQVDAEVSGVPSIVRLIDLPSKSSEAVAAYSEGMKLYYDGVNRAYPHRSHHIPVFTAIAISSNRCRLAH